MAVAGKGAFTLAGNSEGCPNFNEAGGTGVFTVTGGEGRLAGAIGSGGLDLGNGRDGPLRVTGTLSVPGFEFDLTSPTISVQNKTVRAPKRARAVRVRYSASAHDSVDGTVPVHCEPRSRSRFRVGRTKVTCTAEDSSANEATASFTVTVKRRPSHR